MLMPKTTMSRCWTECSMSHFVDSAKSSWANHTTAFDIRLFDQLQQGHVWSSVWWIHWLLLTHKYININCIPASSHINKNTLNWLFTGYHHHLFYQNAVTVWFGLLVFNSTFRTNSLYRAIGVWNIQCVGSGQTHSNINKPNEKNLFHLGFVEVISSPHKGIIRRVFLANHLASTNN